MVTVLALKTRVHLLLTHVSANTNLFVSDCLGILNVIYNCPTEFLISITVLTTFVIVCYITLKLSKRQ